jgi:hypothetical protein
VEGEPLAYIGLVLSFREKGRREGIHSRDQNNVDIK